MLQVLSKTNIIEQFLLEVRWVVVTRSREKNDEVLDTLLFYFDTQVEDLESIANLCRLGLFSSASTILRRVFLALGKMLALVERPSQCEEIRQGKQQKDRDVVDVLENLGVSKDKYIYPSLCESTHLNFNWARVAKYARALGPINEKSHLLTEGILLTALRFTLQSASLLSLFLDQRGATAPNLVNKRLDEHSTWWRESYDDFRQRVDNVFGKE